MIQYFPPQDFEVWSTLNTSGQADKKKVLPTVREHKTMIVAKQLEEKPAMHSFIHLSSMYQCLSEAET